MAGLLRVIACHFVLIFWCVSAVHWIRLLMLSSCCCMFDMEPDFWRSSLVSWGFCLFDLSRHSAWLLIGLKNPEGLITKTRSSAVAMIADRTACSILMLFIVSTTSRPLNKISVCCHTANPINNYYRKFAVRTPLCTCTAVGSLGTRLGGRTERHCAHSQA